MRFYYHFIIIVSLICLLIGQCCASDDSRLAAIRASKMAELLHNGRFGLPRSLKSDRDVYLVITSQPMGDTVFLGSWPSVSESKLSDDLAEVVKECFTGAPDFDYFQDNDNTIVSASYPALKSMVGNWSDTIPVSKFIQNVKARGLIPHVLFRIRSYAETSELGDPMYRSARYLYFNQYQLSKLDDVHVSATSPITVLLIIIIALLLIPALSVWSLSVGIRIMGDTSRSIEQRQAMYRRFCVLGVLLLMMCHQVWIYFFLLSQSIAPGIELWIRSEPAVVLVLTEMWSILLLGALLITGWMAKKTFASISADRSKQSEFWPTFPVWFIVLFLITQIMMQSLMRSIADFGYLVRAIVLIGFFAVYALIVAWLWKWWLGVRLALCDIDPGLTNRANVIAAKMGYDIKDVRVDQTVDGKKHAQARIFTRWKHIIFAQKNLDVLTPAEIDWILAHEIAHVGNRRPSIVIVSVILFIALLCAALAGNLFMKACGLVIVFIFGILLSMIGPKMSRKLELDADRLALETMCDLQSAESGLKHLIEASERPSLALKDTTHPSLEKRIQALRETALRLGLDVPKDDV